MAQCKLTASDFIKNTFNPHVAVLCSPDAEVLCQKNNLTFVELVQPFCRLNTEAHIRDPNNVSHTVHNLKVSMLDMTAQPPQQAMSRKIMSDVVAGAQPQLMEGSRGNVVSIGNYDLQLSSSTPWFEAYRESFLQMLPPSDHEFLNHCLACIFVVSSGHSDPMTAFNNLSAQQYQQMTQHPNKTPRWFCPHTMKYFVLLHDVVEGEDSKADAVYQSMKTTYNAGVCHLLHINSRSIKVADSMKGENNLADPWSQFLSKPIENTNNKKNQKAKYYIAWEGADYDVPLAGLSDESGGFPSKLSEGNLESLMSDASLLDTSHDAIDASGANTNQFSHPLALNDQSNSLNHEDEPLSVNISTMETNHVNSNQVGSDKSRSSKGHGMCLTTSDHDRLKIFIHEFCIRALIPWAEQQMRWFNEQLTSRKGIPRSFLSATKKWFGGSKANEKAVAASQNTTVVYSSDAPELQMRRLADLAFLFHLYEFAYQTYHTAKRDFNNDHAWLHTAGALEMASISVFMQGPLSSQKYPLHYMESAITTYLQSCRNPMYAARATLVSTEALKSKKMFNEAALQFIKLTSEDSDLRSALLLEQAAHCYISMEVPKVRKYAFHMILAGHRFSKSAQRKHALRAYSQALQVYKGKNWSLAEDHINFTLGRQSFNLKQLDNATAAFKHLLSENSKQIASQQGAFLREYLFVYKQLLSQEAGDHGYHAGPPPELPLPVLDCNSTKVLLGSRSHHNPGADILASTGVWVDNNEGNHVRWEQLEEALVLSANNGSLPITYRPSTQCFTNKTNNKYSPQGFVGEPIVVELYASNPLKVMLVLTEVTLLWSFIPSMSGPEKAQTITNEASSSTAKNTLANEIIHTQVIDEIILDPNSNMPIQLTLTPQQTGELRIAGITYNLGGVLAEGNGPKPNISNTIYVRGKQKLEVQGPRLNNTKEEKASKMYGPDRRLDLVIQQEMPLLQVSFCNFPRSLLCGEIHAVMLQFTNIGSSPLHKLKVASTQPEFFTLGGKNGQLPKFPCVYQTVDEVPNSDSNNSKCQSVSKDNVHLSRVVDIDLPANMLQPKSTLSIPVWIRGNDIGGIHEIHFMFYYEPVQNLPNISHRLLRHTAVVNTLESLSVRAVAQRGGNHSINKDGHKGACVILCELENLSQVQSQKGHVKEIQINQVSCASEEWKIEHLNNNTNHTEIQIGCRETMQLCLKADKMNQKLDTILGRESVMFTDVPCSTQQICSAETPCADFYFRSKSKLKPLETLEGPGLSGGTLTKESNLNDLECAIQIGLTLVILWKAMVVTEEGVVQIRVGQHHVFIDKVDTIFTSYPYVLIPTEQPSIKFSRRNSEDGKEHASSEVTSQLVALSLNHQTDVNHNFITKRMCMVPVKLLIQNSSKVKLNIQVDTTPNTDRSSTSTETSSFDHSSEYHHNNSFNWIGRTMTKLQLDPDQQKFAHLCACFSKPGIYNLNRLSVSVTYTTHPGKSSSHNKLQGEITVLQKHTTPSVIIINDVS